MCVCVCVCVSSPVVAHGVVVGVVKVGVGSQQCSVQQVGVESGGD